MRAPPHSETGLKPWICAEKLLQQVSLQKHHIALDEENQIELGSLLEAVDQTAQLTTVTHDYEEQKIEFEKIKEEKILLFKRVNDKDEEVGRGASGIELLFFSHLLIV